MLFERLRQEHYKLKASLRDGMRPYLNKNEKGDRGYSLVEHLPSFVGPWVHPPPLLYSCFLRIETFPPRERREDYKQPRRLGNSESWGNSSISKVLYRLGH